MLLRLATWSYAQYIKICAQTAFRQRLRHGPKSPGSAGYSKTFSVEARAPRGQDPSVDKWSFVGLHDEGPHNNKLMAHIIAQDLQDNVIVDDMKCIGHALNNAIGVSELNESHEHAVFSGRWLNSGGMSTFGSHNWKVT